MAKLQLKCGNKFIRDRGTANKLRIRKIEDMVV